jgi:hypothetical protein
MKGSHEWNDGSHKFLDNYQHAYGNALTKAIEEPMTQDLSKIYVANFTQMMD